MSREEGYKNLPFMSNIDIDIDTLELDSPPSPPLRPGDVPRYDRDQNGEIDHGDTPPQTPYYDYACHISSRVKLIS
jgi:hypothetical protein